MIRERTIADAAEAALNEIGRAASLEEIFQQIQKGNLYQFNTPTPEHVLYTTLQRHLESSIRIDASDDVRFKIDINGNYSLTIPVETVQPQKPRGPRRIMRSSEKESFIQELLSERVGIFKEIWRLLLFAAQIGISNDRREPLQNIESGKGIDQATFGNSASWPGILFLMNLSIDGTSDILGNSNESDDRRIIVFQEYANGGLAVMQDFFRNRTIDLDGILSFIDSNQRAENTALGVADLDLTI